MGKPVRGTQVARPGLDRTPIGEPIVQKIHALFFHRSLRTLNTQGVGTGDVNETQGQVFHFS